MGNKATCPVCGSRSSTVLYDIQMGKNCTTCECPHKYLSQYQDILENQEMYKEKKYCKELLTQNENLIKENFILKTKIDKLIHILGYDFDCPIIDAISNALRIIHDKD